MSNEKQYNKRIDRPTGGAIRFFNNEENEWTEKIFGRLALAIQLRPPEDLFIKENQEPFPMIHVLDEPSGKAVEPSERELHKFSF